MIAVGSYSPGHDMTGRFMYLNSFYSFRSEKDKKNKLIEKTYEKVLG